MHYVYIIYSPSKDSFYIGETMDIDNRIKEHNSDLHIHSFTRRANDWEIYYILECTSKIQAQKIEKHIKRMRNRKYFENIKKYPNISIKLLESYL